MSATPTSKSMKSMESVLNVPSRVVGRSGWAAIAPASARLGIIGRYRPANITNPRTIL